jgi:hypothetical protein
MFNVTIPDIPVKALRSSRSLMQGRFLKGPIPLQQIAVAARLPGQALAVYLAIHHRTALTGSTTVTLPKALLRQFGVSRDSKARSLHALQNASLVAVERGKGRTARVTLQAKHTSTTEYNNGD